MGTFGVLPVGPPCLETWDKNHFARLRAGASVHGLAATREEVRAAEDRWRERTGLAEERQVDAYLRRIGADRKTLIDFLEAELLFDELRLVLSSVAAVERVFAQNRNLFETVEAAGVACSSVVEAEILCQRLRAGEAAFPAHVPDNWQVLSEPTIGGYFGIVTRSDIPPEIAEALFADHGEEFVGPVHYDGRTWVFQILLPKRAEINDRVYAYCESLIVHEALSAESSSTASLQAGM